MEYIKLGRTDLNVSKIGFGGIPIQRVNTEEATKILLHAISKGVNYIDTARGYSVSEKYIGEAIKNIRKDIVVATKAPPLQFDEMLVAVETSLKTMQLDYIDLYQIHNITSVENLKLAISEKGSFKALLQLKQEGKIKHIGLTSHIKEVLMYAVDNYSDLIETIMYPYNIIELQGEDLFAKAKEKNIGVIIMKPLAGGNIDDSQLALKFVFNNPNITIAIPGMGSVKEVDDDINVDYSPLTPLELETCKDLRMKLGDDFCRRCNYCAPCSVGMDIPTVFTTYNYLMHYNLPEWVKSKYKAMKVKPKDCIKCGLCESRCPYKLKIVDKLETVSNALEILINEK